MLEPGDLPLIVEALRPVITAIVQETLKAQAATQVGVSITTATILEVAGPDAFVSPDDSPGDEVQVTRAAAAHVEGGRVHVLHYPPAGGLILPGIPDPS